MKYFILSLIASVFMLSMNSANAAEELVYSHEGPIDAFYLGKDLTGFVKTGKCYGCKEMTFKITPEIKAELNGKPVPLSKFILSKHKPDCLKFSRKTNKLVKITWVSRNEK
ncbi:MAG: hypothetical protein OEZ38_04065 [Gammaproteobacteria bacterium]|nr:hypothetical protein [Gammaproteobacteria bacterium]